MCISLYRPWNHREDFGIYSQLNRKSKIWFFTFLNVYVSWIDGTKSLSHSFYLQNLGILLNRLDQRGDPIKMKIDNFQMQKYS